MANNQMFFDWSEDGLSVAISGKNNSDKTLTLSWKKHSEVPSEEKLAQIYESYVSSDIAPESYLKIFKLPFNKQLNLGFMKSDRDFDEALFRIGGVDLSFPISKDNRLVLKAPKFKKSEEFGFGMGGSSKAAWIDLKDQKDVQ